MKTKRICTAILSLLLLMSMVLPAVAVTLPTINPPLEMNPTPVPEPVYVQLSPNDRNKEVTSLKVRMFELGYFRSKKNLSNAFNENMSAALNDLLAVNGLDATSVISPELHAFIYSNECLPKTQSVVTPTPVPTPIPFAYPTNEPDFPPLTEDGFLASDTSYGEEYVLADEENGLWRYISSTLFIEIRRYSDQNRPLVWYETEVRTGEGEGLRSLLTANKRTRRRAVTIARTNQAVLAFSDDYFVAHNRGVAIRDGEVLSSKLIHAGNQKPFPLTDTLAVFPDGRMRADNRRAFSAQEFLDMGAVHVLNFGPVLVQGGELGELMHTNEYNYHNEPRNALGMIAPNHYVLLTVDGRVDNSIGITMQWLARRMQAMGVVEAINLDGGFTTSLIFMGWQINKVSTVQASGKNGRSMTSLLSFGSSPSVPDKDEDIFNK